MRNGILALSILLFLAPPAHAEGTVIPVPSPSPDIAAIPGNWEKIDEGDGLTVYRRDLPGRPLVEFRGTGVIDASPAKVVGVLLDTSRATEWAADVEESRVLRWIHRPFDYIEYNHIGTPFILKDRDFVSHVVVTADPDRGILRLDYKAAGDVPEAPDDGYVRGDLTGSGFVARPIEGGRKTLLDGWIIADPKGSVPKWIVNLFQKSWPRDTFNAVRKQVRKPDVVEPEFLKAIFEKGQPADAGLASH